MQFGWSVLSGAKPAFPGSFLITHRGLSENFVQLRAWLGQNRAIARRWSDELGHDLASASVLSDLMLAAARAANRDGITLFSSQNPAHIRRNAALLRDDALLATGASFAQLVARDAALIRQPMQEHFNADRPAPIYE